MAGWAGLVVAAATSLGLGLWVALAWSLREQAARILVLSPGVFSQPELAYGPFWVAMLRAASLTVREPRVFVPYAALSLIVVLGGRAPTSLLSDEELLENESRALDRLRAAFLEEDEDDE